MSWTRSLAVPGLVLLSGGVYGQEASVPSVTDVITNLIPTMPPMPTLPPFEMPTLPPMPTLPAFEMPTLPPMPTLPAFVAPEIPTTESTTPYVYVAPTLPPTNYYEGSVVANRNFPPTPGCTVLGQVWSPLVHPPADNFTFTKQNGWDWCQDLCSKSNIPQPDGTVLPCTHFAYFPDGKCFLQDSTSTTLKAADDGTAAKPCEHGFQVVSGPASCEDKANWADPSYVPPGGAVATAAPTTAAPTPEAPTTPAPPTAAPVPTATVVGEGSMCNPSLPPEFAFVCDTGLICYSETGLMGANGTCLKESDIPTNTVLPIMALPTMVPIVIQPVDIPEAPKVDLSGSFQLELGEETLKIESAEAFCGDAVDMLAIKQGLAKAAGVDVSAVEVRCEKAAVTARRLAARRLTATDVIKYTIKVPLASSPTTLSTLSTLMPATLTSGIDAALATAGRPTDVTVLSMTPAMEGVPLPSVPTVEPPPADATILGYYYEPQIADGTVKLVEGSWKACYELCKANLACSYFGYWPDGGCHQQGKDAKLVKAECPATEPTCDGLKVISGPRDLADQTLWPKLNLPATGGVNEVVVSTGASAPKVTESSGGKGMGVGSIIAILLGLAALGGVGLFAYQSFSSGDEEESEEESDHDSEKPILSP